MGDLGEMRRKYLEELNKRSQASRAYTSHQLIGLQIAALLGDWKHKALYIKLAKKYGSDKLLQLAKSVAEKKGVKNRGAYFMKILHNGNFQD